MNRDRRKAVAPHDNLVLPHHLGAGGDLVERNHPLGDGAPDLQTVDHADVISLSQRRPRDDGKQSGLQREVAGSDAARLAVKADGSPLEAGLERLGDLDARDAIAAGLLFTQIGTNDRHPFAPVAPNADGAAVVLQNLDRLIGEAAQHGAVGPAESRLNPAPLAGAEQELFRHGVRFGKVLVQVPLDVGDHALDFSPVVDVDQELNEGAILTLRAVHQQKPQAAAADERRDVRDTGLLLQVLLKLGGEGFCLPDMRPRRQEGVDHELRPIRVREKALPDEGESVESGNQRRGAEDDHEPTEPQRSRQQAAIGAEHDALIRVAFGSRRGRAARAGGDGLEHEVTQERRDGDRRQPTQRERDADHPKQ